MSAESKRLPCDPVCGRKLTEEHSLLSAEVNGDRYLFRSEHCRMLFSIRPQWFLERTSRGRRARCHEMLPRHARRGLRARARRHRRVVGRGGDEFGVPPSSSSAGSSTTRWAKRPRRLLPHREWAKRHTHQDDVPCRQLHESCRVRRMAGRAPASTGLRRHRPARPLLRKDWSAPSCRRHGGMPWTRAARHGDRARPSPRPHEAPAGVPLQAARRYGRCGADAGSSCRGSS